METISRQTVFAGDTSQAWEIGLVTSAPGVLPVQLAPLTGDFSCRLSVKGAAPAILRDVAQKNIANTRFVAWLTPAETAALGPGLWQVGIELRNPALVPPLVLERQVTVKIEPKIVPAP